MQNNPPLILVLPGDGIGHEVTPVGVDVIKAACHAAGALMPEFEAGAAGAGTYVERGDALPTETVERARAADAILLGAMGMPDIRYPDGTEITPQIALREILELYAGVRPVRIIPGLPNALSDPRAEKIDFVIVRESTEGLFASRETGTVEGDEIARDTMVITRPGSERLFDFSARLAAARRRTGSPGKVTCVDKANVFRSFAFFRSIFAERMAMHPDLIADYCYVDAMAHNMIKRPWDYDVLVTENMFGDILSDLSAALVGGMGMAPSADIGDDHAVFQPAHGSAPDIAGKGIANPTAMILSAALLLDWLGERRQDESYAKAGAMVRSAVDTAFASGSLLPFELGGDAGTETIAEAVLSAI